MSGITPTFIGSTGSGSVVGTPGSCAQTSDVTTATTAIENALTSAQTALQGSDATATLTALKTAVAAIPTTQVSTTALAKTSDVTSAQTAIIAALPSTAGLATGANVTSAATGLQGADTTATLTALKTAVAAIPTSPQYTSGELKTFAGTTAPNGWTAVTGTVNGVLSKGFIYSQRLGSISAATLNNAYGTACCSAYAPGTQTPVLYYYNTIVSNTVLQTYNPATDTWGAISTGRPVSFSTSYVNTMLAGSPTLIYTLGNGSAGLAFYSTNVTTATPAWTSLSTTGLSKAQGTMVLDSTGANILLFGGFYNTSAANATAIQSYSISGNSWTTKSTSYGTAVSNYAYVSACLLPSGKILLIDLSAWTYAVYNPTSDSITTASKAMPFSKPSSLQLQAPLAATGTGAILYSELPATYTETGDSWATTATTWGPITLNCSAPTIAGYGTYVMGLQGGAFYLYPSGSITTTITCSKN